LRDRNPTAAVAMRVASFLIPSDLNLASTTSTLVAARRAPMAHDIFDDFKNLLIGGWEE
jgi:hypothetical protein